MDTHGCIDAGAADVVYDAGGERGCGAGRAAVAGGLSVWVDSHFVELAADDGEGRR